MSFDDDAFDREILAERGVILPTVKRRPHKPLPRNVHVVGRCLCARCHQIEDEITELVSVIKSHLSQ